MACNKLFICLLLVSKRNRMMNSPLYCRKNWGLPSSIHWSCTSICNLPPPSGIQNIFKSGLFSSQSQRNQYDALLSQFPVRWYTNIWLHVHLGEAWTFEKHGKYNLKSGAWIFMDFFSNWFGWHTSNGAVLDIIYIWAISDAWVQNYENVFYVQKLLFYVSHFKNSGVNCERITPSL